MVSYSHVALSGRERKNCTVVRSQHGYRAPKANGKEVERGRARTSTAHRHDIADDSGLGPIRNATVRERGDARVLGAQQRRRGRSQFSRATLSPRGPREIAGPAKDCSRAGTRVRSRTPGASQRRSVSLVSDSLQAFPKRGRAGDALVRDGYGY